MKRKVSPTAAFVDESIRGQRYLMGCVLVEARHVTEVRAEVASLVLSGGRVHFHNESAGRRRALLDRFASLPVSGFAVVCHRSHGVTEFMARESCLTTIVEQLQEGSVPQVVLESRSDDREDRLTIERVRRPEPPLVWEHRPGAQEPLLWLADGITWAVGAGGEWRRAIEPMLSVVIELRP